MHAIAPKKKHQVDVLSRGTVSGKVASFVDKSKRLLFQPIRTQSKVNALGSTEIRVQNPKIFTTFFSSKVLNFPTLIR